MRRFDTASGSQALLFFSRRLLRDNLDSASFCFIHSVNASGTSRKLLSFYQATNF